MRDDVIASPLHRLVSPSPGTFIVCRTSQWASESKPCKEAYRVEIMRVDRRTSQYDPAKDPDWLRRGSNHRVDENGEHCRDMFWDAAWAADIPDIMAFVEKYGPCVVSKTKDGFANIEIYDDYRE